MEIYEEVRSAFSKLINTLIDEVALIPKVSYGINAIVSSFKKDSGKNKVIVSKFNFPTVAHIWFSHSQKLEFKVVLANGSLEDYEQRIDDKTLAISLTHVFYVTGFREYIREVVDLAHENRSFSYFR